MQHLLMLCLCLSLTFPATARATEPLPAAWTAEEAVRFALENSPDSRMGRQRIEGAQATIALEQAAFYPQLALVSQYGQTNNPMYSFGNILNQREFSQDINFNRPGRTDNLNNSIQLGYRFFDGGRNRAGVNAAEAQAAATRFELAAVQDRLAFEVVRAFHLINQAEGLIRIRQAEVETVAAACKTAQARFEEGLTLHSNILDLEVRAAEAQENLIEARHNLTRAQQIFLNLLGLPDGEVHLAAQENADQEIPATDRVSKRAELESLDAMLAAARLRIRQVRAARYPALDGYAAYGVDQGSITGGEGTSWQAGLKFQYNLFDGHRTEAESARAEARFNELREQRRKTELAVGLEISQARLALADAEERLVVSEKSVAQAEESLRINTERFAEGVLLASDLIDAQNRLTETQIRRTTAATARQIAIAELRRAEGLPQFANLAEPTSAATKE
ncbi:MAG TPA: TolC family protein [Desulfurivibrionaceae bacterium]|nr:TolC family protein [Desulfurivibrionaceae bacterium]